MLPAAVLGRGRHSGPQAAAGGEGGRGRGAPRGRAAAKGAGPGAPRRLHLGLAPRACAAPLGAGAAVAGEI